MNDLSATQALELLSFHSGRNSDVDHPKWQSGFLGMLRPYKGYLIEDNFHEVMACITALASEIGKKESCPTAVINDLWAICHLARAWALDEEGMLQRNNLIQSKEINQLSDWISIISFTVLSLLDGVEKDEAFNEYARYCAQ